jgi:hypothetical protein
MRRTLWRLAQHKYGWWSFNPSRDRATLEALRRRGLVEPVEGQEHNFAWALTDTGRATVKERWPVSPVVLGTYDHQPGGWDRCEP